MLNMSMKEAGEEIIAFDGSAFLKFIFSPFILIIKLIVMFGYVLYGICKIFSILDKISKSPKVRVAIAVIISMIALNIIMLIIFV